MRIWIGFKAAPMVLLASLWGCSNLPNIESDVCGNQVVDATEDCDGSSPFGEGTACGAAGDSNACFLVCDEDSGATCPAGWGCGTDGRCRRPSGQFEQASGSPWRFPVEGFGIGDVDGDGFADLIGNGSTTITARFGDANGSFPDELDVFTREPVGPVAFQDMSGDGRTDVLVPIAGGLSTLLGTSDRDLKPVAYAPFAVPGGDTVRIFNLQFAEDEFVSPAVFIGPDNFVNFIDETPPQRVPMMDGNVEDLAGRTPYGRLSGPGGSERHAFALAFLDATTVSVWSMATVSELPPLNPPQEEDEDALVPVELTTVNLPNNTRVGGQGAIFGDVNNDGLPDLLVAVERQGGLRGTVAFLNNGTDTYFSGTGQLLGIRIADEGEFEDWLVMPFPLAINDFNSDGFTDYVTPFGVLVAGPSAGIATVVGARVFPTAGVWTSATVGDFNGDGLLDVATNNGDEDDGIFININAGGAVFNPFFVPTELPALELRSGDFDGDLVDDIAFIERDLETLAPDRVMVTFGAVSGSPSAPVLMGELGTVESFEPALAFSGTGFNAVWDLFVVSEFDDGSRSIAVLEGSSTRRMVSPFALPSAGTTYSPTRAVAGSFTAEGAIGDVIVVAEPVGEFEDEENPGDGPPENRVYVLKGLENGQFDTTATGALGVPADDAFNLRCAVWTVGDLNHDSGASVTPGTDELIGFDGAVGCGPNQSLGAPTLAVAGSGDPIDLSVSELPANDLRGIFHVETFDADLDGDLDVIAVFRGEFQPQTGPGDDRIPEGDGVVVYWNNGGQLNGSSPLDGADRGVRSAASMRLLGDDDIPELVILTDDGLYVSRLNLETLVFGELEFLAPSFGYERFEVGDLNGDGLTDIALLFGSQVDVLLGVPAEPRGSELANQGSGELPEPEPLPPAQGGGQ